MVSKPLEALFERVFKVLLQKTEGFMTFSKENENLHAALDWEVMFLTEFSTWKLKISRNTYKQTLYIIFYLLLFYIIFNFIFYFRNLHFLTFNRKQVFAIYF